jgi:hypothetical protein
MPQLDPFTFSSQVFWLITIFLLGYFLFFHFIIPTVYSTLKVRNQHFLRLQNQLASYNLKKGTIEFEYKNRLSSILMFNSILIDNLNVSHNEHINTTFNSISTQKESKEIETVNNELLTYYSAIDALNNNPNIANI